MSEYTMQSTVSSQPPKQISTHFRLFSSPPPRESPGGGALRVKISRGARLEVQNGTQQDLNEIIDLVNFWGKKIVYMLKMGGFEMGPNKIWIKW